MKRGLKRILSTMLAATMLVGTASFNNGDNALLNDIAPIDYAYADSGTITEQAGWFESVYAEWTAVDGAVGYEAYVKGASETDSAYEKLDNELIRQYSDYWRVDAVGLAAGSYVLKIVPLMDADGTEGTAIVSEALTATAYDRSGFAHSPSSTYGTGSGAYNDDGTLKDNAIVVYVTPETASTVTAELNSGTTYTGFQNIIYGKQKGDTTPVDIRIIGTIEADDMDSFGSSTEGLQIKGKNSYSEMNITIEGIGEDAAIRGFGMLIRNCGNVELRNFAVMNCMDDCVSMDTDNCNIWVHNIDFFYGQTGSDSDQAKGDGTVDLKGDTQYVTISYNHLWDSGKASLCGMKSENGPNYITYHHNWFDHSDSRHPRIRTMSVHIYNNYFNGNSKYGVGVTYGGSAFVESNVFEDCKYPMLISKQGTDAVGSGTFSGETGGIIKAYNNSISGSTYNNTPIYYSSSVTEQFDAYLASSRDEEVSSSITAYSGGSSYDNDSLATDNLNVDESDIDSTDDVADKVTSYAGRMNGGDFFESTGTSRSTYTGLTSASSSDVDTTLKSAITSYASKIVSIGGTDTADSSSGSESTTETTTSASGSDTTTETTTEANVEISAGDYIHNFTTSGTESSFYTISGNLSTDKTIPSAYTDLTRCLKMERSTSITFTAPSDGTLTLITTADATDPYVKMDGEEYDVSDDGAVVIDITSGDHTIAKGTSGTYLYYMAYEASTDDDDDTTSTESTTETTTATTTTTTTTEATTEDSGDTSDYSTITSDVTLTKDSVSGNEYFDVSYNTSSTSSYIQLSSTSHYIKFTVAEGATVTVTAKHASNTAGTADRTLTFSNGTTVIYVQGEDLKTSTLGENLEAGTYTVTVDNAINISELAVTFSTTSDVVTGDADDSGTVDIDDVKHILNYVVGLIEAVNNSEAADVNSDDKISSRDAYLIQKFVNTGEWQ